MAVGSTKAFFARLLLSRAERGSSEKVFIRKFKENRRANHRSSRTNGGRQGRSQLPYVSITSIDSRPGSVRRDSNGARRQDAPGKLHARTASNDSRKSGRSSCRLP